MRYAVGYTMASEAMAKPTFRPQDARDVIIDAAAIGPREMEGAFGALCEHGVARAKANPGWSEVSPMAAAQHGLRALLALPARSDDDLTTAMWVAKACMARGDPDIVYGKPRWSISTQRRFCEEMRKFKAFDDRTQRKIFDCLSGVSDGPDWFDFDMRSFEACREALELRKAMDASRGSQPLAVSKNKGV